MKDRIRQLKKELVESCKKCNGVGYVQQNNNDLIECECWKQYAFYVGLKYRGIDDEYWQLTLDDWRGDQKVKQEIMSYIQNLDNVFKSGLSVCFIGSNGVGKTLAAILILKEAYKKGYSIYFTTLSELLEKTKESYDDKFEEREIFHEWYSGLQEVDFLVLDDFGGEYIPKDFGKYTVSRCDLLFRFRRRNNLPTILTTNLTQEEFLERYGSALKSIINSRFKIIVIHGLDFRLSQGKQWNRLLTGG